MKVTIIGLAVMLLFILAGAQPANGEPIIFRFDPPAGTTYEEITSKTTSTRINNAKKELSTTGKDRTTIEKDAGEFRYAATITGTATVQDGKTVDNPLDGLMKGLVLTNHISLAGKLTEVTGYEKLRAAITAKMKKAQAETLLKSLDQQTLLKEEQRIWQEHVGRFIGRSVSIDDRWIETADLLLPTGKTISVYRATLFSGWKTVQGRNVLRIIVHYDAEAKGLAGAIGASSRKVKSAVKHPLPAPKGFKFNRRDDLLVDPATMLIYAESSESKLTVQVPAPGEKTSPVTISEHKEVKYKY